MNQEWGLDWLNRPIGLKQFYWGAQPQAAPHIVDYLNAWTKYAFADPAAKYLAAMKMIPVEQAPRKPKPWLMLYGPNNTGKTEYVARGIARFFWLNLNFKSFQYIHWATYVQAHLDKNPVEVNMDARLLILDDFDGWRPLPKSRDTWLLNRLMPLRNREWPAIAISNRKPGAMMEYFSTTVNGEANKDTVQAAKTVLIGIGRNSFYNGGIEFNDAFGYDRGSVLRNNVKLQRLAQDQDFYGLGFPRDVQGKDALY